MLALMSASVVGSEESRRSEPHAPAGREADPTHAARICPYLRSHDGAWSSTNPSRDLRCWAVVPQALPATQKQRQLCMTSTHVSCSTFVAAEATDQHLIRDEVGDAALWPVAAGVPVAVEVVHSRPGMSVTSPRVGGQALLVGLMVVALLVLVITRSNPLGGGSPSASHSGSAIAAASIVIAASARPSASPVASVVESAPPVTPSPSAAATPTPAPTATPRTYKVRSGDTVASIAAKFHTTVTAIVRANNIVDPRTIHPGQVLVIP